MKISQLFHYSLCPSSRFIRLCLSEKKIHFELKIENYWKPSHNFLLMNPGAFFPIYLEKQNCPIVGSPIIIEFLEESNTKPNFLLEREKHEIRRLVYWFEVIFKRDIIHPLLNEKINKPINKNINPNISVIRNINQNIKYHMNYFNILISENGYFLSDQITYVDLYFASSLSVLEYIGNLDFNNHQKVKDLYLKIKSRPSFRKILKDRIIGLNPDKNYIMFDY